MAAPSPCAPRSVPLASFPPLKRSVPTWMKAVGSGSLRTWKVKTPIWRAVPLTCPVTVKVTVEPACVGRAEYFPVPVLVRVPPVMARVIWSLGMPEALTEMGLSKPA